MQLNVIYYRIYILHIKYIYINVYVLPIMRSVMSIELLSLYPLIRLSEGYYKR